LRTSTDKHTHTHTVQWPFAQDYPGEPVPEGKTNLNFTEARDSEWQWYQLDHMQVCTSLQTDNHASTPPLSFLQAECPSCRPTNSIKALKYRQNIIKIATMILLKGVTAEFHTRVNSYDQTVGKEMRSASLY